MTGWFVAFLLLAAILAAANSAAAHRAGMRRRPPGRGDVASTIPLGPGSPPAGPPPEPPSPAPGWAQAWYDAGDAPPTGSGQPEAELPDWVLDDAAPAPQSASLTPRAERQIGSTALDSTLDSTIESSLLGSPSTGT